MSTYLCETCGFKTKLIPHLSKASGIPTADECPVCGESDDFRYL